MAEGTSNDTAKSKNVKVPVSGGNQGNLLKPKQGNAFNSQQNKQTSGNARGKKNGGRKNNKKKSNQIPWVQFVYPSNKDRGPKRTNVKAASQDLDKISKDLDNLQSVTKVAPTQGTAEELSAALSKSNKDTEKAIDMGKELLRKYQILLNANQQLQADNDELKQQVASTNDLRQEYATARKKYTELIKTLEDLVDGLREENEKLRQHQRIENQPVKKNEVEKKSEGEESIGTSPKQHPTGRDNKSGGEEGGAGQKAASSTASGSPRKEVKGKGPGPGKGGAKGKGKQKV